MVGMLFIRANTQQASCWRTAGAAAADVCGRRYLISTLLSTLASGVAVDACSSRTCRLSVAAACGLFRGG